MKPNDETIAALEELDAGGGEIHDGATEDKFNEIMAYEPPLLPPPELYISKEADQLDQHQLKETGKRYHWKSRNCHVGSYVSMIGLCASTLGKITSVDQIQNRATVDWIIFDLDHWRRYPVSSLCRWSDLYAADALMIERVAPPR